MAADKHLSAANRRRGRLSGWVLTQFQITLALCGMVVGFLVCFGLGFLSGVWFQTQEQMMPHDDAIALADDQLERERTALPPGREMTFYSALTSRDGEVEPQPQPQAERQSAPAAPAVALPSAQPSVPDAPAPDVPKDVPKPDTPAPDAIQNVQPAPLAAAGSPSPALTEPKREAPKPKPVASAVAPKPVKASSGERFYSVQVGSFRRVEQAYRLQAQLLEKGYKARIGLSIVQGKGAWYRVRVGRFADRGAADQTAQRLQKKDKYNVLVMRVSS